MTAEEKLLKIIRRKDQAKAKPDPVKNSDKLPGHSKAFGMPARDIDILVGVNRVLIAATIVLAGFVLVRVVSMERSAKKNVVLEDKSALEEVAVKALWPQEKSFSYFESKIGSRDVFFSPWEKPSTPASPDVAMDLAKDLKLVGIVLDENPKAIVEDVKNNQTLFMSKGETINNAVLKEIKSDKVIFTYNNQDVELTP